MIYQCSYMVEIPETEKRVFTVHKAPTFLEEVYAQPALVRFFHDTAAVRLRLGRDRIA